MHLNIKGVKLLITDLDNTLYDWVTYFSSSFYNMLEELSNLLQVDRELLINEFKEVHQSYENTEQPFAMMDIPSVRQKFSGKSEKELKIILDAPFYAFNKTRKQTLRLYEGVEPTLAELHSRGIIIICHTESILQNSLYRLNKLGIRKYFKHLFTLEGKERPHPDPGSIAEPLLADDDFVVIVPKIDRKPNPRLLLDICNTQNVDVSEVIYVGDSLTKDVAMAKEAGITSVWAKYGKDYELASWQQIVKITHWSQEDIDRELLLKRKYQHIQPDFTIDRFSQLLDIIK